MVSLDDRRRRNTEDRARPGNVAPGRKAGLACFQIEADEAGLCDATSRAMKRATGEPDPMD